ncbi:MAG: M67 family metallopeptidase [Firmicutes bacterium]|nr:M67 family metallopeptidase [Bacillota bacterium]
MKEIIISKDKYQELVDHSLEEKPLEACGILAGVKEGDTYKVEKIYIMENTSASSEEYLMAPEEQFEVFKDIRENELELVSIFHSHPHSPSRPSLKDIDMAYYPEAVYIIISLVNPEKAVFKGFEINDESYQEIDVIIKE